MNCLSRVRQSRSCSSSAPGRGRKGRMGDKASKRKSEQSDAMRRVVDVGGAGLLPITATLRDARFRPQ